MPGKFLELDPGEFRKNEASVHVAPEAQTESPPPTDPTPPARSQQSPYQTLKRHRARFLLALGVLALGYGAIKCNESVDRTPINQVASKSTPPPVGKPVSIASPLPSPEPKSEELQATKTYSVNRLIATDDKADVVLTTTETLPNNNLRFNVLISKTTSDAYMKCEQSNDDQRVHITTDDKRIYPIETFCSSRRGKLILGWGGGNSVSLYSWAVFSGNDIDLSKDLSFKWYGNEETDNINVINPKVKPIDSLPILAPSQRLNVEHIWAMVNPQIEQDWGKDWAKTNSLLAQFLKSYGRGLGVDPSKVHPSVHQAKEKFLTAKYEYINSLVATQNLDEAKSQFQGGRVTIAYFDRDYWGKVNQTLEPYWGKDWASVERILTVYLSLGTNVYVPKLAEQKLAAAYFEWGKQLAAERKCNEAIDKFGKILKLDTQVYALANHERSRLSC